MARFLGAIQGSRGRATRLGTPASGITAQAQGWDSGVKVYGSVDNDKDVFHIYATHGSNDPSGYLKIGVLRGRTFELDSSLRGIDVKTI